MWDNLLMQFSRMTGYVTSVM